MNRVVLVGEDDPVVNTHRSRRPKRWESRGHVLQMGQDPSIHKWGPFLKSRNKQPVVSSTHGEHVLEGYGQKIQEFFLSCVLVCLCLIFLIII